MFAFAVAANHSPAIDTISNPKYSYMDTISYPKYSYIDTISNPKYSYTDTIANPKYNSISKGNTDVFSNDSPLLELLV